MPTDISADMLSELRNVMSKVNETMGKLSVYSSSMERLAEDRATIQTLKEKLQELKGSVDELYDLMQKDTTSPAVFTRLSRIEGSLRAIDDTLKTLEKNTAVLPGIQNQMHDFEKDCMVCKESVEERLDAIEGTAKEEKKNREEYSRNFKISLIAAIAPQILTWLLAILGYVYMMSQQATVATNAAPDTVKVAK